MSNKRPGKPIKRREFIANLLFAGGALSLASLQGELAATGPEEEGWELPPDWNKSPPKRPQPPPKPPKPPEPIIRGSVAPPLAGKPAPPPPRNPKKRDR